MVAVMLNGTALYTCRHGSSCARSSTAYEHTRDFEPDVAGSSRTGPGGAVSSTSGAAQAAQAAPETISQVVDTRLIGKPESFSGVVEARPSFAVPFQAYMGACGGVILTEMTGVLQLATKDRIPR